MLISNPIHVLRGSINAFVHGEHHSESVSRDFRSYNQDPLYRMFKVGNDMGYVRLKPSGIHSPVRAFSPVEKYAEHLEDAWLHTLGPPSGLTQWSDVICYPSLSDAAMVFKNVLVRVEDRHKTVQPRHENILFSIGALASRVGNGYTVKRCVRCMLTLMHPLTHLLQPNRLTHTMTIVYSVNPRRVGSDSMTKSVFLATGVMKQTLY